MIYYDTPLAILEQPSYALPNETNVVLVLRANLIKLETELLEGEVTSVISSGETLLLVIGAQEAREAKVLQARVKEMSDSWQSLLRYAEAKKSEASTSSRLENCLGLSDISDRLEMLSTAPPMTSSQGSISLERILL